MTGGGPGGGLRIDPISLTVQDSQLAAKWESFLQDYCHELITEAAFAFPDQRTVTVPFNDVQLRDPDLSDYLLDKPGHCLRIGAQMLRQVTATVPVVPTPLLHLAVKDLPEDLRRSPRQVGSRDLGKLVPVYGLVTAASGKLNRVLEAAFDCKTCGNRLRVIQENADELVEPVLCDSCEKDGPWAFRDEDSRYIDAQVMRLQELPETTPPGQTPEVLTAKLYGDLAGTVQPGTRVIVSGILRTKARRVHGRVSAESENLLEAIHVQLDDREIVDLISTPDEVQKFKQIAARGDVHEQLAKCIAPSILGLEGPKLGFLYAFVGGRKVKAPDGSETRGRIHVLLAGDPGVAKSRLLGRVRSYVPRCIEVLGLGANEVGLMAGIIKDDVTGEYMVEPGALVLAHGGVCAVDEFGLVDPDVRPAFNSCMEDGYVSRSTIKKTGKMPAEAIILAAMNPPNHRFDDFTPLMEQLGMPPALRSRYDLIWCLRDRVDKARDRQLAQRQLGDLPKNVTVQAHYGVLLDSDELRRYVHRAREIDTTMTPEAFEYLAGYYVEVRQSNKDSPAFTPRQLDALKRLAAASARLRLSTVIEVDDAKRAIDLMADSLRSCGIIDAQGRIDGDLLEFGVSKAQQDRIRLVTQLIKDLSKEKVDGRVRSFAYKEQLVEEAAKHGIGKENAEQAAEELVRTGVAYRKGGGGTYALLSA